MSATTTKPAQHDAGQHTRARTSAYRVDIDGLRGYAIGLVVLFHVFVGRVSGGVDVFLLLSGYFFLGGQLRYAMRPNPSLNPWWPLWRTMRRLVPALVVVILSVFVAVHYLTPELMSDELAAQFTASMLYYQNWELMVQAADYAAASQDTSPLQHLWSMAVQGQFYLFGILLGTLIAFLITKCNVPRTHAKRGAITVLAIITIASLAWASRFGFIGNGANYYSTFSRAWELSLGALLAFVPAHRFLPQKTAWLTSAIGIVCITITGAVVSNTLAFPGPIALLPLIGAALVILSGDDNPVSKVLASKPMTWLGGIAYSLYLWHWPMLIIVTVIGGFGTPPAWVGVIVIAASLALAHVTHVLLEQPLRQHRKRPKATDTPVQDARRSLRTPTGIGRAIGGVVIAALVGAALTIQPLWNQRVDNANRPLDTEMYPGAMSVVGAPVPDVAPQPDPNLISGIYPPIGSEGCMVFQNQEADVMPRPDCIYGDKDAETTIVMVGGSHIEPYVVPLDRLGREHGFKIVPFVRQTCPLTIGGEDGADLVSDVCFEWSQNVFEQVVNMQPDLVVSTSTRPEGRAGDVNVTVDHVPDSYLALWNAFAEHDIPFLGFRDNPWIFNIFGEIMDPNICIVSGFTEEECSMRTDDVYGPVDPAAEYLDGTNNQFSVDTAPWFCDAELCRPQIGNVYVYRDQNHISNAYMASLTPLVWQELRKVFDALEIPYTPTDDPEYTVPPLRPDPAAEVPVGEDGPAPENLPVNPVDGQRQPLELLGQ